MYFNGLQSTHGHEIIFINQSLYQLKSFKGTDLYCLFKEAYFL